VVVSKAGKRFAYVLLLLCGAGIERATSMRIHFKMEGGLAYFPGLSRPVTIDSSELPAAEATELQRLVDAAGFFDRPETSAPPPRGAADYQRYTITIEENGRRHTIELTDPVGDPDLQRLLAYLRGKAKALRSQPR
jgi:hypothetical protein